MKPPHENKSLAPSENKAEERVIDRFIALVRRGLKRRLKEKGKTK